jgi:hypothetical protein
MLFLAAFHAMVIIAFVSAIPSGRLPKPSSPEPKENNSFDLDKEQRGYFTTGWTPNTMTCFNRTLSVVDNCYSSRHFVGYKDELETPEILGQWQYVEERGLWCYKELKYLRDNRNYTSTPLVKENIIYIKSSNSNESQGEYALSKEVVWQVEIPETYGAYLIMNPINLQPPVKGICVDYVAVDFHGDDREPDVACGNVNIRHYVTTKSSRLTIKFVSDESINAGFFHGGLLIYPAHSIKALYENHRTLDSLTRMRRKTMGGSGYGGHIFPSSSKGNAFLDEVPDKEEPESDSKELSADALLCFSEIVQYGYSAAIKYLSEPTLPQCKLFAEVFLEDDYVVPA